MIALNPADENEQQGFNLDQFIREVDENQTTVHSHFSVNTQDSAIYEHAPLQCGNIRFDKESNELPYEVSTEAKLNPCPLRSKVEMTACNHHKTRTVCE